MSRRRAPNGNGTIRHRSDGRWEAIYSIGRSTGTGKLIRRSLYATTAEEASKKLRAVTAAIDDRSYIEPEKMPLKQWLKVWLQKYTGGIKESTQLQYEANVRLHINPALGAVRISELRTHDIQSFLNRLYRGKKGKVGLSAKTTKNIHGTLHKALDTAVKVGYIRMNPSNNIELPRIEREEIQPLDDGQIDTFLVAIQDSPSEAIFYTALYTGMRLSELLGLTWRCVDFKKETIKVDKQLLHVRKKGMHRELGTPKNSKPRKFRVASAVIETLRFVKKRQIEARLLAGEVWDNPFDLVFTDNIGGSIPHSTVEHQYKRIIAGIGIPNKRFHDLRHTYATMSISLGIPIKTISEALGHYSTAFTMDVYGHVTQQMQDDAASLIQASIIARKRNA